MLPRIRGVRFAHDYIAGFEHRDDAERFLRDLRDRFAKFARELHPQKTRLIEFGRHAAIDRYKRGDGRAKTFDFLGFTHICARTKRGRFKLKRITIDQAARAQGSTQAHPDRDAQFGYVNTLVKARLHARQPVISVDTSCRRRHEVSYADRAVCGPRSEARCKVGCSYVHGPGGLHSRVVLTELGVCDQAAGRSRYAGEFGGRGGGPVGRVCGWVCRGAG